MKTKQQIVEILKEVIAAAFNKENMDGEIVGNLDEMWNDYLYQKATAIEQLEPEGESREYAISLIEAFLRFLHDNGYTDSDVYDERPTAVDQFMREYSKYFTPPPQQPSEGEIDALVTKLRADKTLGINEDKKKIIKAAIKELLNR